MTSDGSADLSDDSVLYFAYGSNMSFDQLAKRCPSAREVGKARLRDHRLRFSRKSQVTDTGVADITPERGFTVMGVVYRVPRDEWPALRRKEGLELSPPAYAESEVDVFCFADKTLRRASTFTVVTPEPMEQVPSADYLDNMIRQVEERGLWPYAMFLKWIEKQRKNRPNEELRTGLLPAGTSARHNSRGRCIVRASPRSVPGYAKGSLVSVTFDRKVSIASLHVSPEIPEGLCEIDQNLRHALGMVGQNCYGYTADLQVHHKARLQSTLARPRNLCLKVRQTNWMDSEKRICILHPYYISMIGVNEGDHVEIECSTRQGNTVVVKTLRIRAYSSKSHTGQQHDYPAMDHIYLDLECRRELGLPEDRSDFLDWPLTVRPSVIHLLRRRAVIYGITFFLGTASLSNLFSLFIPALTGTGRGLVAILTAIVATITVAVMDVRVNVGY
ncbi:gamma-glutamylcyclotransferase family protein [Amycolatopsis sp. NPDC049159]|uniref:gamma-glutamylcyclotransferase family protein n=1 Tax=Amycolatopsis sp. NPDC049159 TaxID=3157210 RepID=UPI0034053E15